MTASAASTSRASAVYQSLLHSFQSLPRNAGWLFAWSPERPEHCYEFFGNRTTRFTECRQRRIGPCCLGQPFRMLIAGCSRRAVGFRQSGFGSRGKFRNAVNGGFSFLHAVNAPSSRATIALASACLAGERFGVGSRTCFGGMVVASPCLFREGTERPDSAAQLELWIASGRWAG